MFIYKKKSFKSWCVLCSSAAVSASSKDTKEEDALIVMSKRGNEKRVKSLVENNSFILKIFSSLSNGATIEHWWMMTTIMQSWPNPLSCCESTTADMQSVSFLKRRLSARSTLFWLFGGNNPGVCARYYNLRMLFHLYLILNFDVFV